jgi:hypothetical protein
VTDTLDPHPAPPAVDAPPANHPTADPAADEPISRTRSLVSLAAIVGLIALITVKFGAWALVIAGGLIISIVLHELGHYLSCWPARS